MKQSEELMYHPSLRRVSRYVEIHIGEPISLVEAAQQANLSKAYFSRFFHNQTGLRFQDWLAQRRVEHAKAMLSDQDAAISKVAFDTGFGSISAFERAFKKWEGTTARSFRRRQRERLSNSCKQTRNG